MADLFDDYETITTITKKVIKTTKTVTKRKKAESVQPTLFEDDIVLPQVELPKKKVKAAKKDEWIDPFATGMDTEKALKSKKVKLSDKLKLITDNTLKILGKQKDNTIAIKTKEDFHNYISAAISKGRIAVDTETNNSLDPITCKIMGLCLYVPGEKQVYIPINHVNPETDERLAWQLTEQDIKEEMQRIIDAKMQAAELKGWTPDFSGQSFEDWYKHHPTVAFDAAPLIVMHNGKFDYKVLKCTCNIEVKPDWDTLLASKLIDENEKSAGLKTQYITKIDPSQEKYAIDHLFAGVQYAQVDPDLFDLYAATDSMMTDKLYLWQLPIMKAFPRDSLAGKSIYDLFHDVEMVNIIPTASMELNGVYFDKEYAERLRLKFDSKLSKIDAQINDELTKLEPTIAKWKETPGANFKKPKADKAKDDVVVNGITYRYCRHTDESAEATPGVATTGSGYWFIPEGEGIKRKLTSAEAEQLSLPIGEGFAKSKVEQLENPISMSSPTQLAILLYDILGCEPFDNDAPRSTGEEALEHLKDSVPLCGLLLVRRGVVKLLDAFITSLPENVNPKTGKIHGSFNQYGAATGRFSSSNPNLQQIPSHEKSIRMLFRADTVNHQVELSDNYYEVPHGDEVETATGWKRVEDLHAGDKIVGQDNQDIISAIMKTETGNYRLYI